MAIIKVVYKSGNVQKILLVLSGLVFSSFIFFNSTSLEAKPTIAWTPTSVNQTLGPNETVSIPITFTSSQDLTDVVFTVVPEINAFVSLVPNSFQNISENESKQIMVNITLPFDADFDSINGTIHVKSAGKGKTLSKPLPVVITNNFFVDGSELRQGIVGRQKVDNNGNVIVGYINDPPYDYTDIQITEGHDLLPSAQDQLFITNKFIKVDYPEGFDLRAVIRVLPVEPPTQVLVLGEDGRFALHPFFIDDDGIVEIRDKPSNGSITFTLTNLQ